MISTLLLFSSEVGKDSTLGPVIARAEYEASPPFYIWQADHSKEVFPNSSFCVFSMNSKVQCCFFLPEFFVVFFNPIGRHHYIRKIMPFYFRGKGVPYCHSKLCGWSFLRASLTPATLSLIHSGVWLFLRIFCFWTEVSRDGLLPPTAAPPFQPRHSVDMEWQDHDKLWRWKELLDLRICGSLSSC